MTIEGVYIIMILSVKWIITYLFYGKRTFFEGMRCFMTALKKPLCGILAFILVFAFVFATPISVFADDEETTERPLTPAEIELNKDVDEESGFEYIKVEAGSAIEIVGYTGSAKNIEVPKKIGNLSVISIGASAFEGNKTIETVELNGNILRIGDCAFKDCTSLVEIDKFKALETIGISAFEGCTSLKSFKLPDAVTAIPERCFANCSSLKEIDVHKNIKSVAKDALVGSAYEKSLPNGALYLGRIVYSYKGDVKNVVIPEDISIIEAGAFLGNTKLEKITFGYDVEEIGDYAFQNCTNLKTIVVDEAMGILGAGAFKGCTALTVADFSETTLAYIGYEAFSGCTSLKDVKLSETTSEIGDYAFAYTKIEKIEFGKNINSVGANSFLGTSKLKSFSVVSKNKTYSSVDGVLYNKDGNELVVFPAAKTGTFTLPASVWKICDKAFYGSALTSVKLEKDTALSEIGVSAFENSMITSFEIPAAVTKINAYTFKNAAKLATVKFNDGLTYIGASAFEGCASLKELSLPKTVYTIANGAFKNAGLETVKIGDGVAKIYTEAFAGNTSLKTLNLGKNVETISADAFSGCSSLAAVELPASLKNLEPKAFSGCMSLTTITVNKDNKNYKAIENVVYSADGKKLVMVGGGATEVTVAAGTEVIVDGSFDLALNVADIKVESTTLKNIEAGALDGTAFMRDKNGVVYVGTVLYKVIGDIAEIQVQDGTTAIAENAAQNATVQKITFVDTVVYIGTDAFAGSGLTEVVIPDSVTYIGAGAFRNCKALSMATLPAGITEIASSIFKGCDVLTSVIIPAGVKTIKTDAFANCINLTGVDFGTVEVIEPYAFANCSALAVVELPKEIDVVDGLCFVGCTSLKSINLTKNESKKYKSEDGVLLISNVDENGNYTGEFQTIALYPAGREGAYAVPATILHIADRAFYNCDALTEITFSDGFLTIGAEAFYDCDKIKSVNMPASATSIGDHAFASCDDLVEFIVNSNLTVYAENAFEGCRYFDYNKVTINAKDNSALFIIIIVAVLVLIGVIWFLVYKKKQKKLQAEIIAKNKALEELEAAAEDAEAEETKKVEAEEAE